MYKDLECCAFSIADVSGFKKKVLTWLRPVSTFCFLDNQQYRMAPQGAECLIAAGVQRRIEGHDLKEADRFFREEKWVFGHLSYALKKGLHHLPDTKEDKIGFPPYYFYSPQVVLALRGEELSVYAKDPAAIFNQIMASPEEPAAQQQFPFHTEPVLTREAYLQKINALKAHILRGDCYEINFCQEFFAENAVVDPHAVFQNLMAVSPNPFSAFYRLEDKFLVCASPERFLAKRGNRLISQPIKGTSRRDLLSTVNDERLKEELKESRKEQAENVMVVDLVRNDLTRVCKPASVKVDELFGLYTFPQVHQMISTISGEMMEGISFSTIMEATFPMGSMTGAPKLRVMKLIDQYEPSARGLFSGSVGYKAPGGDFDWNVVIRSVLYNSTNQYLSYLVGSGITHYSEAEKEWEECMLKAEAIKKVLTIN